MSLCQSIDTLSMTFLDDELAPEERRELELHLHDCGSCRDHVDRQRGELELLRKALVAPPASAMLKARIARALDAEDAAAVRSERRRWSRWVLPGSAMMAAAAAILVFVGAAPGSETEAPAIIQSAKLQIRPLPLEVRGAASTGELLRNNRWPIDAPQFTEPSIELQGARLLPRGIANHDAVFLRYLVTFDDSERVSMTAIVVKDLRGDELSDGDAYRVGNRILRVHDAKGVPVVTYVDPQTHVGYVFGSERMTAEELLRLVVSTDLFAHTR
jgi:hypothetical protein